MTTGENQPKPIILDALVVKRCRITGLGSELLRDSGL
jgi:hypothetical protein